jgi:hydrogenase nickel incorporation protein HypA/HybF
MHEVGLMQEALRVAVEQASRRGGRRIHAIHLRVGALSGVVPEALAFAFEVLSRGTPAEGGRLEIERVPAVFHCAACDREFEAADLLAECPACGTPSAELRRGRELAVASLDIS